MADCLTETKQHFVIKETLLLNNESSVSPNSSSNVSRLSSSPDLNNKSQDNNESGTISDSAVQHQFVHNSPSQANLIDQFNLEDFIKNQLQHNFKDRLFMLNTERCLVEFIKNEKADTFRFGPMNPYFRMFVHRISEYFGLAHNCDQAKCFIIVNKTERTKLPLQSFQAIIKAGELANNAEQSTMASPNSPSSPSLVTTDSTVVCNQEANRDSQIKKKQILKREVNIQEIQNSKKLIEPMKTKTFEEKSADYIRIKNRIFNTEETFLEDTNSGSVPSPPVNNNTKQYTILTNQNQNNKFDTTKQSNKNVKQNGFKNNDKLNYYKTDKSAISSSRTAKIYHQQQQQVPKDTYHRNQSFKINNENLPTQSAHDQYLNNPAMFQNHIKYQQQPQTMRPHQPQYNQMNQNPMVPQQYYSQQMPLHMQPPPQPYYIMNNSNQQNVGYYQQSYSREHLNILDPNNPQYYQQQQKQNSSQSQMFLNQMPYHQVQNLNQYHPSQITDYSAAPPQPTTSSLAPSNQNLTLSSSSSSSLQQQINSAHQVIHSHFVPAIDDNNYYKNINSGNYIQKNDANLKQSASFNSLPFNYNQQYPTALVHHQQQQQQKQPFYDAKLQNYPNQKFKNNNYKQFNNNRNYNQSSSSSNLNKQNFNSFKQKNFKNSFTEDNKRVINNATNQNTDSLISFQVYNLKQNFTKKMLHDLLKPFVVSIDFKPTLTNQQQEQLFTETNESNDLINEDNENVFIKFENVDKLREAFKSFNLKETYNNGMTPTNGNDLSLNQHLEQPFLLKQIGIC